MTDLLTLDKLLASQEQTRDVQTETVGTARLQLLPASDKVSMIELLETLERDEDGAITSQRDAMRFGQHLLGLCVVDAEGNQPFDSPQGRQALGRMNMADFQLLVQQSIDLNGLGPSAVDADLEDAKKN